MREEGRVCGGRVCGGEGGRRRIGEEKAEVEGKGEGGRVGVVRGGGGGGGRKRSL